MGDPVEKEQVSRVEKYAQTHLDRVHTISAGATRTALLWLVALVIIWFQQLEPKLIQVRQAQLARRAVVMSGSGLQTLGLEWQSIKADDLAKKEQLELPFSIKFSLPPELISTLWLALAFGLGAYMIVTRKRVLRLAARGLRLLETEVNAEPPYVRTLVGEGVWWLTPLPTKQGEVLTAEKFRGALGWTDNRRRQSFFFVLLLLVLFLLLLETRVIYIGFCIASFLPEPAPISPNRWILVTSINGTLLLTCVLSVYVWFIPVSVPDAIQPQSPANFERRQTIILLLKGAAVSTLALGWAATATYLFARLSRSGREVYADSNKRRSRRKKSARNSVQPSSGLFINAKTGVVHTAECKRCLAGLDTKRLQSTDGVNVAWSERKLPTYLGALRSSTSVKISQQTRDDQNFRSRDVDELSHRAYRSLPHPHAAHRVFMIEQRVFEMLDRKDNVGARQLLVDAVGASSLFGLKETLRLYDLLAGLCIRFGGKQQLKAVVQTAQMQINRIPTVDSALARESGPILAYLYQLSNNEFSKVDFHRKRNHEREKTNFQNTPSNWSSHNGYLRVMMEKRISKWADEKSHWYERWNDTKTPVRWAGRKIN